jgi:hypothetical protein
MDQLDRVSLQAESDPNFHLELDFGPMDRPANIAHFEPIDIVQGLRCLRNRIAHRLLDTVVRHAHHFNDLVGFLRQDFLLELGR